MVLYVVLILLLKLDIILYKFNVIRHWITHTYIVIKNKTLRILLIINWRKLKMYYLKIFRLERKFKKCKLKEVIII